MERKIQNNHNEWHKGVDELLSLIPGTNPVHGSSWERLEDRLRAADSERQKKTGFYWIAATLTSALLISSMVILLKQHNIAALQKNNGKSSFSKNTVLPDSLMKMKSIQPADNLFKETKNVAVSNNSDDRIGKKAPITKDSPIHFTGTQLPDLKNIYFNHATHRNADDTLDKLPAMQLQDSNRLFAKNKIINASPVKKSMNIIHMNDLTDTLESTPGMTIKVKPLRRFIRGTGEDDAEKAAVTTPVKEHTLNKSTIQN